MTLMCDPTLIIADEPTTALDVTIQAQILHLLDDLQREYNMALILITHDLGVVARMADRVVVMYAGQVVETGTAEEIFAAPRHPYTRGLLDCIPIPGKTRPGAPLGSIPGIVPVPARPDRELASSAIAARKPLPIAPRRRSRCARPRPAAPIAASCRSARRHSRAALPKRSEPPNERGSGQKRHGPRMPRRRPDVSRSGPACSRPARRCARSTASISR